MRAMHLKIIQPPFSPAILSFLHQYVSLLGSNLLLIVYYQLSPISTVHTGTGESTDHEWEPASVYTPQRN